MTFKYIVINRIPVNMEKAISDTQYEREVAREERIAAAAPDLHAALQFCYEYLDGIPESAAGGDDEAVRLARIAKIVLNSI
jgi:hypothetical protein